MACVTNEAKSAQETAEAEERKAFAKGEYSWLRELGFTHREAYSILRAAGPGQVRAAIRWAENALKCYEDRVLADLETQQRNGKLRLTTEQLEDMVEVHALSALHTIFRGLRDHRGRVSSVLCTLGLPHPGGTSADADRRVIAGARQVLIFGLPESDEDAAAQAVA